MTPLDTAWHDWLDAFAKVRRVIVAVWRPSDVPAIEKVLR